MKWRSAEGHTHIATSPCEDCNRMTFWCEDLLDYFHYAREVTCGLIRTPHPQRPKKRRKVRRKEKK